MVELSKNSVSAITRRLREIPRPDRTGKGNPPRVREVSFWARITDVDADGAHDWTRVFAEHDAVDGLEFEDWPVETTGTANAYALGGQHVAAGTIVRLHLVTYDGDGAPVYAFQPPPAEAGLSLFPVKLAWASGSNGSASGSASYLYNVSDMNDTLIGSSLAPQWARPVGRLSTATRGTAYWNEDDELVLWQVDETPETSDGCA